MPPFTYVPPSESAIPVHWFPVIQYMVNDAGGIAGPSRKPPLALPPLSGEDLVAHAWSDEEIECYGVGGFPRGPNCGPYFAWVFDMRMRQWYHVTSHYYKSDPGPGYDEIEDPYWSNVLRGTGHRGRIDFNRIDVDPVDGSLILSLQISGSFLCPNMPIVRPPRPVPTYPRILYTELQDRQYLEYSVESCTWEGRRHAFKQHLMDAQVKMLDIEIELMTRLIDSPHIVHFNAYVVDEDGDLRGILLPWAGEKLDSLPSVRWTHFRDVAFGLRDIHSITIPDSKTGEEREAWHGDVFSRNILVDADGVARLIDMGNEGLDYPGDREALADVLAFLKDKAEDWIDKTRMTDLEEWLRDGMGWVEVATKIQDAW